MSTAQVNASLTGVYAQSGPGEWRDAAPAPGAPVPGTTLWEGSSGAYLVRARRTVRTQPSVDRVVEETLHVDMAYPAVTYEAGMVIRFETRTAERLAEIADVVDTDPDTGDIGALAADGVMTAALVLRSVGAVNAAYDGE